jgi:hypothetical protein
MRIKEIFQESVASDLSNLGRRAVPKLMERIRKAIEHYDLLRLLHQEQTTFRRFSIASPMSKFFQPKELRELYEPLKDVEILLEIDSSHTDRGRYEDQFREISINLHSIYEEIKNRSFSNDWVDEYYVYEEVEGVLTHELRHALDHFYHHNGAFGNEDGMTTSSSMKGYKTNLEWNEREAEVMADLSKVIYQINKELEYHIVEGSPMYSWANELWWFDFKGYLQEVTHRMHDRFPKLRFDTEAGDPSFYKPFVKKVYKAHEYELRRLRRLTDNEEIKQMIDNELRKGTRT